MIIEELIGTNMVKHYSSEGKHIIQVETGEVIEESATDAVPCPYTYEEYDGEMPIDESTDAEEILDILMGVSE